MKDLFTLILVFLTSVTYSQIISDMGNYNDQGVPSYLDGAKEEIRPALLHDIDLLLPDGVSLQMNNPDLYNRNTLSYITLRNSGDVYLSFISEGADFTSAVGFYTFQGRAPMSKYMIRNMKTVFPNVSGEGSGGGLKQGDRVKLGYFDAGTSIGFFLVADAFKYGRVMAAGNDIFYTESRFNPESDDKLKKHSVMLYDQASDRYVLLFEDFYRQGGSDHDFNDAIFVVSTGTDGVLSTDGALVIQDETEVLTQDPEKDTQTVKKIVVCHYPPGNRDNPHELEINESAWPAHRDHGDQLGPCEITEETEGSGEKETDIDGLWKLECQNDPIEVQRTGNGIRVRAANGKWFDYTRTSPGSFSDEHGNKYDFESDSLAIWTGTREFGPFGLIKVSGNEKVTICHFPPGNRQNPQEITISENAWPAHEKHGDIRGGCVNVQNDDTNEPEYEVAGSWSLQGRNQENIIRVSPTGIEARSSKNNRWFSYTREGPNTYKDEKGNTYLFDSANTGEWISGNGKTVIRLVRN